MKPRIFKIAFMLMKIKLAQNGRNFMCLFFTETGNQLYVG